MSWRGKQSRADRAKEIEFAEQVQTTTYKCRLCGWLKSQDGCGYDHLMLVCGTCATRMMNLYNRKHGGQWWHRNKATDEDLAYFGERRDYDPTVYRALPQKAKISSKLRFEVYERDGFKCVYCGARQNLSLDHVKAESKGGETVKSNLVTACKPCNSKKKTKSLADFWDARQ